MMTDHKDAGEVDQKNCSETDHLSDMIAKMWPKAPIPTVAAPVDKYANKYNMGHPTRGTALIFNNNTFLRKLGLPERHGTDVDANRLVTTLDFLGFENIEVHKDLSVSEMKSILKEVASADHTKSDCILISVLSHGFDGGIFAFDGKFLIDELWGPFLASECPSLAGKPKIFFIQACRGTQYDHGINITGDEVDGIDKINYKIPACADFFIAYSTVSGYFSWRDKRTGSWFIQCLCQVFEKFGQTEDLASLLTMVNQKVAIDCESSNPFKSEMHEKKQIPCQMTMLTRKVFFAPKAVKFNDNSVRDDFKKVL